jgi:hypothetical protein
VHIAAARGEKLAYLMYLQDLMTLHLLLFTLRYFTELNDLSLVKIWRFGVEGREGVDGCIWYMLLDYFRKDLLYVMIR